MHKNIIALPPSNRAQICQPPNQRVKFRFIFVICCCFFCAKTLSTHGKIYNNIDDSRKRGGELSAIGRLQKEKIEPVKNDEIQFWGFPSPL